MLKRLLPSNIKKAIKLNLHSGNKYICPFCGYSSKDLSPIGIDTPVLKEKEVIGAGLRNAGCYNCGSKDRERLIYIYLKETLNLFDNKNISVLHLAPEKNLSTCIKAVDFKQYICGDLFTEGYKYPEYVQNMNVLNIPFGNNSFDLIICNHLLEHIPNDIDAMKELYRVLKIDGKAILQVPISKNSNTTFEDFTIVDPKEREKFFGQFDHVRIYGQDYIDRLQSVGFKVDRINISGIHEKYGLNPDEDIFIGIK